MLTFRSLSLVAIGLLLGFSAAAQTATTEAPMPAANADMMAWMLKGVLCAAGLVMALAIIAITTAAVTRRAEGQPAGGATPPAPHTW